METLNNSVGEKIKVQYIFALLVVASLTIFGQLLIQSTLSNSLDDSHVINIAGRQRMLSQRLTKISLILNDNSVPSDVKITYIESMSKYLNLWQLSHKALKNNKLNEPKKYNVTNSNDIKKLYDQINPYFLKLSEYFTLALSTKSIGTLKLEILANERNYLELMEKIVFSYDLEATKRVNSVKKFELILLFLTIGTLLVEAFMIFSPLVNYVNIVFKKLSDSEKNLTESNERLRFSNRMLLKAQEKLEYATKEKYELKIQEEINQAASLLKVQEEERRRMSREMHDGVGQVLTAIKLVSSKIKTMNSENPKFQAALENLNALIIEAIDSTRTVSFNLMPPVLEDYGIEAALKIVKGNFEKTSDVKIKLDIVLKNQRLAQKLEINIYRIIQEALNNTIKHAKAKNIIIRIIRKEEIVFMEYSDDGIGFDETKINDTNQSLIHNGLANMKTRCKLLGGIFKLTSSMNQGTNIFIKLPIHFSKQYEES